MPSPASKTPGIHPSWPRDSRLPISAGLGVMWLLTACALLVTLGVGGYNLLLAPPPPAATPPVVLADTPLPENTVQPTGTPAVEGTETPLAITEEAGPVQPGCEDSWLFVHEQVFRVEPLPLNADGSVTVPADIPGAAYWLEGPPVHHAFGLSRTPENVDFLAELQVGEQVTLLWTGCVVEETTLLAVESHLPGEMIAYSQDAAGVSLFMQEEGTVVAGEPGQTTAPPGQATLTSAPAPQATQTDAPPLQPTPTTPPTDSSSPTSTFAPPPPGRGEIEAEVGFLGKQVSASTITIDISVYNYGASAFSIYGADVHLIPPGQTPISPTSANPALPYQLGSRAIQVFSFTFPNPGGGGLVFQIFEIEFDLDDF